MQGTNASFNLTMSQVQADLFSAEDAIKRAESLSSKQAKYIKGIAGYHLQQAAEKMIKIQLYASGQQLNYSKLYKHSLDDLLMYANSIGITMRVPAYVNKNKSVISSWEAEGRYDVHFVVKITQLKACINELQTWYDEMINDGYK